VTAIGVDFIIVVFGDLSPQSPHSTFDYVLNMWVI